MKAYSQDLRKRILETVQRGGRRLESGWEISYKSER